MHHFVYILECADTTLYVGCTNDLNKRLKEHNGAKAGAHYTKIRRPVVLKYSERFVTLGEARAREYEIKGWRREKKIALFTRGASPERSEGRAPERRR
ncbi:MAG: GIY-YIG nuclease family protein [bacterium]|nr:GIY-YIG nuclease family protein [bacterium]